MQLQCPCSSPPICVFLGSVQGLPAAAAKPEWSRGPREGTPRKGSAPAAAAPVPRVAPSICPEVPESHANEPRAPPDVPRGPSAPDLQGHPAGPTQEPSTQGRLLPASPPIALEEDCNHGPLPGLRTVSCEGFLSLHLQLQHVDGDQELSGASPLLPPSLPTLSWSSLVHPLASMSASFGTWYLCVLGFVGSF